MDPIEALKHIRTLARAAQECTADAAVQKNLEMILALVNKALPRKPSRKDHPPPEDEYGGGDIVSVEREPSTDDDRPLE